MSALPNGHSLYYVCYGDGTAFGGGGGTNDAVGVNISLPTTPVDGTRVILYSSVHRNSSSANECLRLNFPGLVSGVPDARRISAAGTATAASVGINIVCPASNNHSKNHCYIFSSDDNVWVQILDMN